MFLADCGLLLCEVPEVFFPYFYWLDSFFDRSSSYIMDMALSEYALDIYSPILLLASSFFNDTFT